MFLHSEPRNESELVTNFIEPKRVPNMQLEKLDQN